MVNGQYGKYLGYEKLPCQHINFLTCQPNRYDKKLFKNRLAQFDEE